MVKLKHFLDVIAAVLIHLVVVIIEFKHTSVRKTVQKAVQCLKVGVICRITIVFVLRSRLLACLIDDIGLEDPPFKLLP